jgi:hypothetical protein
VCSRWFAAIFWLFEKQRKGWNPHLTLARMILMVAAVIGIVRQVLLLVVVVADDAVGACR